MPVAPSIQTQKSSFLRHRLFDKIKPVVAVGAHDALSAKLAEEAGFDAVWVSSFGLSTAQKCQPDANVLTMTEVLDIAKNVEAAVGIPVIADCDTGYGDAINVMRTVAEFEQAGIAAISIEDNLFPKRCSLYPGARPEIAPMEEMVGRVKAAKAAQRTPDFIVIARTEALIAGMGLAEAERRAKAYAEAGADAILIHSKNGSADEVLQFAKRWELPVPLVVVPTMFPQASVEELHGNGFQLIIFANQVLRAAIRAMEETLKTLKAAGKASAVNSQIVPLDEVYRIVGLEKFNAREKQFIPQPVSRARAIILAAGFDQQLLPLVEDRPKTMLDIKGKSILERQLELLQESGVTDIVVVRGYKKEAVSLPGIRYVENERYKEQYILSSLFCAEKELSGPVVVLYGDILFDQAILEKLLDSPADFSIVVDQAWADQARSPGFTPTEHAELVITEQPAVLGQNHRFLPQEKPGRVVRIGRKLESREAVGEFIGLALFSGKGTEIAKSIYAEIQKQSSGKPLHESASLAKAGLTDFIQELINRKHPVASIDIYKGWLEVNTFDDYRRAWAKL